MRRENSHIEPINNRIIQDWGVIVKGGCYRLWGSLMYPGSASGGILSMSKKPPRAPFDMLGTLTTDDQYGDACSLDTNWVALQQIRPITAARGDCNRHEVPLATDRR